MGTGNGAAVGDRTGCAQGNLQFDDSAGLLTLQQSKDCKAVWGGGAGTQCQFLECHLHWGLWKGFLLCVENIKVLWTFTIKIKEPSQPQSAAGYASSFL